MNAFSFKISILHSGLVPLKRFNGYPTVVGHDVVCVLGLLNKGFYAYMSSLKGTGCKTQ